jgi:hypothetical protein
MPRLHTRSDLLRGAAAWFAQGLAHRFKALEACASFGDVDAQAKVRIVIDQGEDGHSPVLIVEAGRGVGAPIRPDRSWTVVPPWRFGSAGFGCLRARNDLALSPLPQHSLERAC